MEFVFLISSERSGSNLITKMMDSHPRVCGPSPKHILRTFGIESAKLYPYDRADNWERITAILLRLLQSDFAKWQHDYDAAALAALAERGDLRKLLASVFEAEAASQGKDMLFIKEIQIHACIPFINALFPGARFVYLVRDPRDMALSWRENAAHPGGLVAGAIQWRNDQAGALPVFGPLAYDKRAVCVRYEDLIQNPEQQLGRICNLLGISYAPEMLQYHQSKLTQDNAQTQEAWKNLSQGVMSQNHGKFSEKLSAQEVAVIEAICAPLMPAFGYTLASNLADLQKINNQTVNNMHAAEIQKYPPRPGKGPFAHDVVFQELNNMPFSRLDL
ncbi:MAG: sulfotransferase [Alcanivoracaceae bacterium]|jgi:hypothetical protein|nr:sulfotransferase [Alcanivoracaceae bacterium]